MAVEVDPAANIDLLFQACSTTSTTDPDSSNDCDDELTVVVQETDLAVDLVAQTNPVVIGDEVVLNATARNFGPSNATGVGLVTDLYSGLAFSSADPPGACTAAGNSVSCDLASLTSGEISAVTITTTAVMEGTFNLTASISGNETDPNTGNNSVITSSTILPTEIFTDGFESGDTSAWSRTVP